MIRDAASQRQVDAADPRTSTWLSANAGSGKTRVLTDRVARLLLEKVSPQNILCLTYTKAAAAEMQNRLFKRLGNWAMMADDALRADLTTLGVDRAIDDQQLREARTLFARAIETPGGLKIQTIHSFCAGVLRRFPLEAQVSPQFREMEDRAAELLRAEVLDEMIAGPDAPLVREILHHFTGAELADLTAEVANKRDAFAHGIPRDALCARFGLSPTTTADDLTADLLSQANLDTIHALAKICAKGSATEKKAAAVLDKVSQNAPGNLRDLALLESVFLFGGSAKSPFGAKIGSFPTKGTRETHAALIEDLEPIMLGVQDAREDRLALNALERSIALYKFGAAFVPAYEQRKLLMGALDFDDLIRKAKALLTDRDVAQWVLFRLDGGIDHVLVDEAQDTSPTQWAVIEQLTQEFASGEGAHPDRERTVFVVGDKKQSIYSFQGADPTAFDDMKVHFRDAHHAVDKPFEVTSLDHSFRSSQAILSVVDATFTGERAAGMDDTLNHIAFKENMPGRVDLWPVIEKPATEEPRNWFDPVDLPSETDHTVLMANRIAAQIKRMIADETIPEEIEHSGTYNRRPITEGDFLVLVQRRSELFSEIIRACKSAGLKIAGADRLRVGAELAVKDLAALLNFLALPEDDLSLAAALRSPLFGWSEQDLFTLAHHRPEKGYLWPALRDSAHSETLAVLRDLRKEADFLRPYDLIERILTRHDGRRKLLARLGPEAEDGIDALLSQALAYESTGVPSLTGFLSWMETDDLEVKRQMDAQGDRIRVMTVHGSKGLEAPIVILPDTAKRRVDVKDELLPADDLIVWKSTAAESGAAMQEIRNEFVTKQQRERMRLLYVAMTRAEKWLIVGAAGEVGEGDESWYNIVAEGMATRGDTGLKIDDMEVRRVAHMDWEVGELIVPTTPVATSVVTPSFGPIPELTITKTLSPSEFDGAKVMPGDPADHDGDAAKLRGTLIHKLLEYLPEIPKAERKAIGHRLIEQGDPDIVDAVITLLDEPHLAHLWDSNALSEVDVTAHIDGIGRIHGTIDRLIVNETQVLAVDYKSNHTVPSDTSKTPMGILRQMAAYFAALRQIYPDHDITVGILWTQNGQLDLLSPELLHETLKGISIS
ncbi:double-strand break repair helicase AddA [Loktanella sp. S4079]|uniref:double-strand break repair helicase AddA n=1 Tax=Loktanella sp. S4079 TaxID=579483 RepID=UPI0005F9F141|nr:double-strand break repair helicase AddA [Loktanella sp. S4079]KJZ19431.1 helicase UvrD [Loktanella sp. S4079]